MAGMREVTVRRSGSDALERAEVIEEQAVALSFNGTSPVVLMATPENVDDLAIGFALSEGIIDRADELSVVECLVRDGGIVIECLLPETKLARVHERRRVIAGNSACGLCGTEQLAEAMRAPRHDPLPVIDWPDAAQLEAWLNEFARLQRFNARTGGAHAAAFVDDDGLLLREDVGRHNAFDKMVGARARAGRLGSGIAIVSSRASYELVHKAVTAGIGMLIAMSAPTSAATTLASAHRLRLGGFARGRELSRYT